MFIYIIITRDDKQPEKMSVQQDRNLFARQEPPQEREGEGKEERRERGSVSPNRNRLNIPQQDLPLYVPRRSINKL